MRCPKCEYITFDHVTTCPKCNKGLSEASTDIQGTSINVKPPSLLGSVTKQSTEPSVDDMLSGHDIDVSSENDELSLEDTANIDLSESGDMDLSSLETLDDDVSLEQFGGDQSLDLQDDSSTSLPELDLEPAIDDEDVSESTMDKISAELNDIDISDLVGQEQPVETFAAEEDDIPTLEPISEDVSMPNLEALSADADEDIPELTPLDEVSSTEFESDELKASLAETDLSDFDPASLDELDDSLNDFGLLEEEPTPGDVLSDEPPSLDLGTEESHQVVEDSEGVSALETLTDMSDEASAAETLSMPEAETENDIIATLTDEQPPQAEQQEAGLSVNDQDFDLSFDDSGQEDDLQTSASDLSEIGLSLDEDFDQNIISKNTPQTKPDIPDLGLTLESED